MGRARRCDLLGAAAWAALLALASTHPLGAAGALGRPARLWELSPKASLFFTADASRAAPPLQRPRGDGLDPQIGAVIEAAKCRAAMAADFVGKVAQVPTGLLVMAAGWVGIGSSPRKSADLIGWYTPERTTDMTGVFSCMLSAVKEGHTVLPSKYSYIFVPGFMWKRYPGYFSDTIKHFKKKGLSAQLARVRSEGGLLENGDAVYRLVRETWEREGKPTVLVGHSKGGLDSLYALAEHKGMAAMVRGLVCIQSPFGGSPIATDIVFGPKFVRDAVAMGLTAVLGGSFACIDDLTHKRRQEFFETYSKDINKVPVLCFSTMTESLFSFVSAPAMYIKRIYGEMSDGLVPLKDSLLSGALTVQPEGDIHHLAPVMPSPPWGYKIANKVQKHNCLSETRDQLVCNAAQMNEAIVGTMLFASGMGKRGGAGGVPLLKDGLARVHDKW